MNVTVMLFILNLLNIKNDINASWLLFMTEKEKIDELQKSFEDAVNYMDHCKFSVCGTSILIIFII